MEAMTLAGLICLVPAVLIVLGLSLGGGRCRTCGTRCAPWSAFCARCRP